MLNQARSIYETVKQEISIGPGNIKKSLQEPESERIFRRDTIQFCRDIVVVISKYFIEKEEFITSQEEINIYNAFISATLAQLYKVGNCSEYTHLALVKFLIQGIKSNIEMIHILDHQSKTDHALLLGNREIKSNIKKAKTWKDIILLDGWPGVGKVEEYPGYSISEETLLNPIIKNIDDIQLLLRIDKNFTLTDWKNMSTYLESARFLINEETITFLLKKYNLHRKFDAKTEVQKIYASFTKASEQYKLLPHKSAVMDKSDELKITGSPAMFNDSLKKTVCDKLKSITSFEWMYFPAKGDRKSEARYISLNRDVIVTIVELFSKGGIKVDLKKLPQTPPPQFVAQFQDVTLEKLEKLEKILDIDLVAKLRKLNVS